MTTRAELIGVAARRHAPLHAILSGFRSGNLTRALQQASPDAGSLCDGYRTRAGRSGVVVNDVRVTWAEVAALIEANVSPGLLAAAATALRSYANRANEDRPPLNDDPLWHAVVWRPSYRRCVQALDTCREAFTHQPDASGQLALF